ncbi:MAG TPA: Asp-tRNA(Asn)/Glu-tRNA(Gln) amidotransferase subunit GatC [Candidatus Angelobacter sp.]|nr:Asp-tRNA(Asn)/Glu-tRNA(Gln) amidotransferase subunit GatC [Candidatus Angelobacter sp.]
MSISEKDVAYVADLANLELTPEERVRFAKDLTSILEYIGRLNELNTEDVPPMAQVSDRYSPQQAVRGDRFAYARREDTHQPCLPHEAALQNAPVSDGDFFKVPRVIEK